MGMIPSLPSIMAAGTRNAKKSEINSDLSEDESKSNEKVDYNKIEQMIRDAVKSETNSLIEKLNEVNTELINLKKINQKLLEHIEQRDLVTRSETENVPHLDASTTPKQPKTANNRPSFREMVLRNNTVKPVPNKSSSRQIPTKQTITVDKTPGEIIDASNQISNPNVNNATISESNNDNNEFHEVRYRKRRPTQSVVGTSKSSNGFQGIKKKVWLHVGRVQPGTECHSVLTHLKERIPNVEFIVEKINTPYNDYVCFKVGADFEHYDALHSIENWPEGTVVKRYNFFRSRRSTNTGTEA